MISFSVKNFRSLEKVEIKTIKPLNILVGKNSAGKSSLLRIFPLLKQSAEFGSKGILLWSGKYVDFGDFETTVYNHDTKKEIELRIEVELPREWISNRFFILPKSKLVPIELTIRTKKYDAEEGEASASGFHNNAIFRLFNLNTDKVVKDYINTIIVKFLDITFEISYDDNYQILDYKINNINYSNRARNSLQLQSWFGLLPSISEKREEKQESTLYSLLLARVSDIVHGKVSLEKKRYICDSIKLGSKEDTLSSLKSLDLGQFGHRQIESWQPESHELKKIRDIIAAIRFENILESVSSYLSATFGSSKYMTPLRPAAERYYRNSNIAVEELDPTGANIAMFLLNLGEDKLAALSDWTNEQFGFGIALDKSKSHISIQIIDPKTGSRDNIADTGFGHSQILPVIVQLWTIKHFGNISSIIPYYLVIEQPELHLHPSMQGKLGRVIALLVHECINNGIDVKIIIETHSEDLINNIGRAVRKDGVDPSLVAISIFEKHNTGKTKVTQSKFDKDGFLENWPYGFFEA